MGRVGGVRPRLRAHGGCARANPDDPDLPALQRAAARVAPRGTAAVPRPTGRARRARPGRDPRWRLLRAGARGAPPSGPARAAPADGRRARDDLRTPTARSMARRTGLGAGPANGPRRWRVRLDDRRRRPLPRGVDP